MQKINRRKLRELIREALDASAMDLKITPTVANFFKTNSKSTLDGCFFYI